MGSFSEEITLEIHFYIRFVSFIWSQLIITHASDDEINKSLQLIHDHFSNTVIMNLTKFC